MEVGADSGHQSLRRTGCLGGKDCYVIVNVRGSQVIDIEKGYTYTSIKHAFLILGKTKMLLKLLMEVSLL